MFPPPKAQLTLRSFRTKKLPKREFFSGQMIGKPGSVVDDHLSRPRIAPRFKRIKRPAERTATITKG